MLLEIKNFKCFENISVPFRNLTTLAGTNGMGKSTVIQSLLLLRQSVERYGKSTHISLNGPWGLNLGSSGAITNINTFSNDIVINFKDDNDNESLEASYSIDADDDQLWITLNDFKAGTILSKDKFYYLSAERIGPRISQELRYLDYLQTGIHGEYTAQTIDKDNGRIRITPERMREGTKDPHLPAQVNAWLDYILPGVSVKAQTDVMSMTAQIRIENYFTHTHPVLPTNIGFGISYILPIITTGLIADPDTMLIVENPESHLHPAAQSAMGQFLAFLADRGLWVVVETHSDHIINGMQIYVAEKKMKDKAVIDNFSIDDNSNQPNVIPVFINDNGDLSEWPKGFLDQNQIDYIHLNKVRSNANV